MATDQDAGELRTSCEDALLPAGQVLSRHTLRALATEHARDPARLCARLLDQRRIAVSINAATAAALDEASRAYAAGPTDAALHPADRAAAEAVSRAATDAGYLWGRLLLGTADTTFDWDDGPTPAAGAAWLDETIATIDFAGIGTLPAGCDSDEVRTGLDRTCETIISEAGHPRHDELECLCFIAFDSAVATAMVEHGRGPETIRLLQLSGAALGDRLDGLHALRRVAALAALSALLELVDGQGNGTEADVRYVAAISRGGDAGHATLRELRRRGLIDYKLTANGSGWLRIPDAAELCAPG